MSDPTFLDVLFGGGLDPVEVAAGLAAANAAAAVEHAERLAAMAAAAAATAAAKAASACPKCGGSGHIAAYQHYKGGSCFKCCGTGVIS